MNEKLTTQTEGKETAKIRLVGVETALCEVFPDERTRPCLRSFNEWKALGYFPWVKIGKRVFVDPEKVSKALVDRFTIPSIEEV